jgi:hypothetical protein
LHIRDSQIGHFDERRISLALRVLRHPADDVCNVAESRPLAVLRGDSIQHRRSQTRHTAASIAQQALRFIEARKMFLDGTDDAALLI